MSIFIIWNIVVFALYGIDKFRAINGKWRISEKTLLISAFLMGGVGAFLGMQCFRHKTRHTIFVFGVPIAILLNFAVIYFVRKGTIW